MRDQATSSSEANAIREEIEARFGGWNEVWEQELQARPAYLRAVLGLEGVAERQGAALDVKARAFVRLALEAAVTHLRPAGVRRAIREALSAGATSAEVFEVLMVACTIGVHGMNADVLAEVLAERAHPAAAAGLSAQQLRIRQEYTEVRGYWREFLNDTLRLAPEFLEAYLEFSGAPWRHGALAPKVREFIYLAFDTSPTHLHMTGLRIHMHNALDHGASPEEIVEVMALAAAMGLQSLELGVPILAEESRIAGMGIDKDAFD